MGITIRHDAPAFAAAFGTGMAAGQQRRRKYALAMLMQNQRLPSMRGGMGGSRAGGGGGRPGVWTDPLALPSFEITGDMSERDIEVGGRKARVVQNAAIEGRARKMRLGKPLPSEWTPTYTSGEELDRRDELADAERDRKWKVEDREDEKSVDMARATRESMGREFGKLPPIPKNAPPDVRSKLQDARKTLHEIALSGNLDTGREEVLKAWNETWDEYNALMEGIPEPTGKDAMTGDVAHIDTKTGRIYDEPIPGVTRPFRPSTDKFLDEDEKRATATAEEKRRNAEMAHDAKVLEDQKKFIDENEDVFDTPTKRYNGKKALDDAYYEKWFGSGAAPSAEGGTAPPVGTGTVLRPDGETAAPAETPPGAPAPPAAAGATYEFPEGATEVTIPISGGPAVVGAAGGPPVAPTANAPPIDPYEAATRKPPVTPTAKPTAAGQPIPFDTSGLPDAYWPNQGDRKTIYEPNLETRVWDQITDPKRIKRMNIKVYNDAYDKILPEGKKYGDLTGEEKAQLRRIIEGRAEVMEW